MMKNSRPSQISWPRAAAYGAEAGAAMALLYALAFIVYAVVRSTINLLATPDADGGLAATLLATWVSLALPALTLGIIFGLLAALVGALTALALKALMSILAGARSPRGAVAAGVALCLAVSVALFTLLCRSLGLAWSPATAETLTFWLVLPLVAYVIAGAAASWQIRRMATA
jgi:hypothetical protein